MLRTLALATMIGSFLLLGICDLTDSEWRKGVASILLAVVQAILFWR